MEDACSSPATKPHILLENLAFHPDLPRGQGGKKSHFSQEGPKLSKREH